MFVVGGAALAEPMVIADPEVEARSAPSADAPIERRLTNGFVVCSVEQTTSASAAVRTDTDAPPAEDAARWTAVRVGRDVLYVPATAVRAATSASAAAICDPSLAMESALQSRPVEPETLLGSLQRPSFRRSEGRRILPRDPFRFTLGFATGAAFLKQTAADQHHIGAAGPTVYVTFGLVVGEIFSVSTSLGAVFPRDHASFEEDVVPLFGAMEPTTATSTLQVTNYSIAAGPRSPLFIIAPRDGGVWAAGLFADFGWSRIDGDRFIDQCRGCLQEDLELPDGTFFRIGADVGSVSFNRWDTAVMMNIAYQRYLPPSGLTQEIRLGLALWFL